LRSKAGADQLREWIRSTVIEVAPQAETVRLGDSEYLKSEVGMNIILPAGRIEELRLKITLKQRGASTDTFVTDGFPNSGIDSTAIVGGQVRIGVTKALTFIPVIGPALGELLSVEIDPWDFHIGTIKHLDVAFGGGLTPRPEWYFRDSGLRDDTVRIAMLLKKAPGTTEVDGEVQAAWLFNPGLLRKVRVGSDARTLRIFDAA
jgi:hypothetical protein